MAEAVPERMLTGLTPERWERVSELFEAALERAPAERAGFVARATEGDVSLGRELFSLLDAQGEAAEPVDRLVEVLSNAAEARMAEGTRVGPYELMGEIGRGGMGIVCLARRADGQYERLVALKIARSTLHDRTMRERFVAERDILAGLSHPNIAALYDGGVTADGYPYFTME